MARVGSFSAGVFRYGEVLSIAHPSDNVVPQFDPEILAETGLTEDEQYDLQAQIDELTATLKLSRDY